MLDFLLFQEFYNLDTEKNIQLIWKFSDKYEFLTNLEKSFYLSLIGRYNRAMGMKYNEYDIERFIADIDRVYYEFVGKGSSWQGLYELQEIVESGLNPDLTIDKIKRIMNFMDFSARNDSPTDFKKINISYSNLISYYHSILKAFFSHIIT